MMYDFYKILGVERNATVSDIKRAYRSKAKLYHPDVNPSASAHDFFTILNNAHVTLTDETKRRRYNLKLEYELYQATKNNDKNTVQKPHRSHAYRRNTAKEYSKEKPEGNNFEPSNSLFLFLLFSIMFVGMLCIFIPSLAMLENVVNFGTLVLFIPGFFMIRDTAKAILVSE